MAEKGLNKYISFYWYDCYVCLYSYNKSQLDICVWFLHIQVHEF